jgi:hypothetical protein
MKLFALRSLMGVLGVASLVHVTAHPVTNASFTEEHKDKRAVQAIAPPNCFPALGFKMPSAVPSSSNNWWCDYSTEYAFVGFSYEITACGPSVTHIRGQR